MGLLYNKLKEVVESADHKESVLKNKAPGSGRAETAGFINWTLAIPDDPQRSNRIKIRSDLEQAFNNAGFKTDSDGPKSSVPVLQVYNELGGNLGNERLRIFFKKEGGTHVTEFSESIVCYTLAIHQKLKREITIADLIDKNYNEQDVHAFNKGKEVTLKACLEKLSDDWVESAVQVANAFYRGEPVMTSQGPGMKMGAGRCQFHRGDAFMNNIEASFKPAIRATKDGRFAGMNLNKWNPADIWISQDHTNLDFPGSWETIGDLNRYLDQLFFKGKLKGLSLKKTISVRTNIVKVPTAVRLEAPITFVEFRNHTFAKAATNDVYIDFTLHHNKGVMQFRSFDATDHQGSIQKMQGQSSAAVHGKVGIYDKFLVDYVPRGFTEYRLKSVSKINAEWNKGKGYQAYMLAEMMEFFYRQTGDNEATAEKILELPYNNFGSKYLGMQLVYIVNEMTAMQKQDFLSDIVTYAMSQIPDVSSVHLKNK